MTIKITLEFNNAAEAIVALDRISSPAPAKNPPVEASQAAQAPAAGEPVKRGRGRPTVSVKNKGGEPDTGSATAKAPTGTTPAVAPTTKAAPAPETAGARQPETATASAGKQAPAPAQAAAPTPGPRDVVAALQKVLTAKGMPTTQVVFQRWGVSRGAEVKEEDRAKFIAYCEKVAAGEIDPTKGEGLPT